MFGWQKLFETKFAMARVPSPAREMGALPKVKIVAIANQKGGVGKTTTAVNLAWALAEQGQRMLLVDLDPQANATSALGLSELQGESLYEALLGGASVADKIVPTRLDRLFVIPADLDLAGAEVEIARMDNHVTRLAQVLSILRSDQTFDFVFLDCPPSLGILMTNALAAADELLTPIQCEYFALEGLVKIVRVVEQVRDSGANSEIEIGGIVMTMYDSRTNLSAQVVAEVRQHFSERVYDTVIPRTVRLSEAPSFGKSVLEYDRRGAGAEAYRRLAGEFIRRHVPPATAPAQLQTQTLESLGR
jgi:chromosome partitioning protein